MKRIFFALAAVIMLAVGLVSCNSNTPKAAADKFLTSFYHMDYKEAKTVSTEETKKMLDMIEQFSTMIPDSAKANAKKIKVTIKDVKEEGEKAVVTYTTSENTTESKLDMIKQEGKWLVQFNKQDQGVGDMNSEPLEEEPVTGDSTTVNGPVDTTIVSQVDGKPAQ